MIQKSTQNIQSVNLNKPQEKINSNTSSNKRSFDYFDKNQDNKTVNNLHTMKRQKIDDKHEFKMPDSVDEDAELEYQVDFSIPPSVNNESLFEMTNNDYIKQHMLNSNQQNANQSQSKEFKLPQNINNINSQKIHNKKMSSDKRQLIMNFIIAYKQENQNITNSEITRLWNTQNKDNISLDVIKKIVAEAIDKNLLESTYLHIPKNISNLINQDIIACKEEDPKISYADIASKLSAKYQRPELTEEWISKRGADLIQKGLLNRSRLNIPTKTSKLINADLEQISKAYNGGPKMSYEVLAQFLTDKYSIELSANLVSSRCYALYLAGKLNPNCINYSGVQSLITSDIIEYKNNDPKTSHKVIANELSTKYGRQVSTGVVGLKSSKLMQEGRLENSTKTKNVSRSINDAILECKTTNPNQTYASITAVINEEFGLALTEAAIKQRIATLTHKGLLKPTHASVKLDH